MKVIMLVHNMRILLYIIIFITIAGSIVWFYNNIIYVEKNPRALHITPVSVGSVTPQDSDGDGREDWLEELQGTNPFAYDEGSTIIPLQDPSYSPGLENIIAEQAFDTLIREVVSAAHKGDISQQQYKGLVENYKTSLVPQVPASYTFVPTVDTTKDIEVFKQELVDTVDPLFTIVNAPTTIEQKQITDKVIINLKSITIPPIIKNEYKELVFYIEYISNIAFDDDGDVLVVIFTFEKLRSIIDTIYNK